MVTFPANSASSEAVSNKFSSTMFGVVGTPPATIRGVPFVVPTPPNVSQSSSEPQATLSQATSVGVPTQPTSAQSQRWKMVELRLLILLKKDEFERSILDTPREKIKTAEARWKNVTAGLLKYGFNRKQALIQKKWEKLMTDFKKNFDYQRRPPSGELGYFEMRSEDRKHFNLPPQYDSEVYKLMECWVPGRRAVQPDPYQLMDSSFDGMGAQASSSTSGGTRPTTSATSTQPPADAASTQQEESAGGSQPAASRGFTQPVASEAVHTSPLNGEGDQLPVGEDNSESNAIPDHPAAQGRLLKKSKRDRLDDHFKNANAKMVKAMAS